MDRSYIAYTRVSTEEQAAYGYGLAAQEGKIREAATRRGFELAYVARDEGQSAKTLERPALQLALEQLAAGDAAGLIVAKLDRLTRSVVDFGVLLEWFAAAGVALVALDFDIDTSTPGGRLVANVMVSVAEWERDVIAQRTRDGLAAARAQGKPTGRPAVADRPELAEYIQELRASGLSLQAIADRLNAERIPTARGASQWSKSAIQAAAGYKRRVRPRKFAQLPEIKRR